MISIAAYTLEIAIFSTIVAAAIGIPLAFFCARRNFFGKKLILASSIVPLCIPALIVALANVSFFGVNGSFAGVLKKIAQLFGRDAASINFTPLYSTFGIILVQGFYNFPLITGILCDAWKELPQDQENAARLLGAKEIRILFTITLRRLSGAIAAACIPIFLYSFFSFMIILLFSPPGHSTLEVEIYRSIRNTLQLKSGIFMALFETITALFIVWIYSCVCRKSQTSATDIDFVNKTQVKVGKIPFATKTQSFAEQLFFWLLIFLVILFFLCPAISIVFSSFQIKKANVFHFTFTQFTGLFKSKNFITALWNSCWVGVSTGVCCCILGFIYSSVVKIRRLEGNVTLQTIPLISMALSSVVIGWVFSLIFHKGTPVILIVIQTILYWPIAYRQIQNGINRISQDTLKAAILLSKKGFKGKIDILFRIFLPSCINVIKTAFGYCFAMSVGDATLPLVLSIPKFNTLAFYTYRLASSYRFNQACASAVILSLLCASVLLISKDLPQLLRVLVERFGHTKNQDHLQA